LVVLVPALTLQPLCSFIGTKHHFGALTRADRYQAMLTALTILSLISLLVATEAEPTSSPTVTLGDAPLRPGKKPLCDGDGSKRDQIPA
jgi:hypothetical protein